MDTFFTPDLAPFTPKTPQSLVRFKHMRPFHILIFDTSYVHYLQVLPRLAETLGQSGQGLPQAVLGHDAVNLVQVGHTLMPRHISLPHTSNKPCNPGIGHLLALTSSPQCSCLLSLQLTHCPPPPPPHALLILATVRLCSCLRSESLTSCFEHMQAAWIAIGLPPTVFLTLKLCEENGFGEWRQAAQLSIQAALTLELWHLMIR